MVCEPGDAGDKASQGFCVIVEARGQRLETSSTVLYKTLGVSMGKYRSETAICKPNCKNEN